MLTDNHTKIVFGVGFASDPAGKLTTLIITLIGRDWLHVLISCPYIRLRHLVLSTFDVSPCHVTPASRLQQITAFLDKSHGSQERSSIGSGLGFGTETSSRDLCLETRPKLVAYDWKSRARSLETGLECCRDPKF